jgi:hypothetical protein
MAFIETERTVLPCSNTCHSLGRPTCSDTCHSLGRPTTCEYLKIVRAILKFCIPRILFALNCPPVCGTSCTFYMQHSAASPTSPHTSCTFYMQHSGASPTSPHTNLYSLQQQFCHVTSRYSSVTASVSRVGCTDCTEHHYDILKLIRQ